MKEIHFYSAVKYIPDYIRFYSGWIETSNAIAKEENEIHTTQMGLLNTGLLVSGYRVFIHENPYDSYEIKLGSDNTCTEREIKIGHNIFTMWKNGVFG